MSCGGGLLLSDKSRSLGVWLKLVRFNFLLLAVLCSVAGILIAYFESKSLNYLSAFLTVIGAVLIHMAVNVLNNYFDYKYGVDAVTIKTPFSGGVDVLVKGYIKPSQAYLLGILCLLLSAFIGIYIIFRHFIFNPPLMSLFLAILLYGGFSVYFYNSLIARIPALSEFVAGTNFGLITLGSALIQMGYISGLSFGAFIIVSILVGLLLLLNEFPDVEADLIAGRRHSVILLGRARAAKLYVLTLFSMYFLVILFILTEIFPITMLLNFITIPLAWRASKIVLKHYDNLEILVKALAFNTLIVLINIGLISISIILSLII